MGTMLNDVYKVQANLGGGTFARVVEVLHTTEGKVYACKVQAPFQRYLQYDCDAEKEALLTGKLSQMDPEGKIGIPIIKEHFKTKDKRGKEWGCLVMERLGLSLFDFVRANGEAGLEIRVIQSIARQILSCLAFLHKQLLTHTDIKHKNVLLVSTEHHIVTDSKNFPKQVQAALKEPKGPRVSKYLHLKDTTIRVIDFANMTHVMDPHMHPIHVKQWRAPEVHLEEAGTWDEKSDLWCVGILLYYLYTGALPFNTQENEMHLAMMERALGPMPEHMIRVSKKYKGVSDQPIQRWYPGIPVPMEVLNVKPLKEIVLPDHEPFGEFLAQLLQYDPMKRPRAAKALEHPFFTKEFPAEVVVTADTRTGTL